MNKGGGSTTGMFGLGRSGEKRKWENSFPTFGVCLELISRQFCILSSFSCLVFE